MDLKESLSKINWSKSHCGLYRTPLHESVRLMPEIEPVLLTWPGVDSFSSKAVEYTADVKVHMLMPGQWPCIPNWHYDNVPRDRETNVQDFSKRDPSATMWLWLSGPPLTVFRDAMFNNQTQKCEDYVVPAHTWHRFNQWEEHRGTVATEHGWRCFIRLSPYSILKPAEPKAWLRRHSQVYLDAGSYKW